LNVTSTGQSIHAQSSGESEFYGNVSGISAGLCMRHILKFFGYETQIVLASDSSAARAVLARAGVGKTRHLEVKTLWVQDMVRDRKVIVRAVRGELNVGDIGTKILGFSRMQFLKRQLGIRKFVSSTEIPIVLEAPSPKSSAKAGTDTYLDERQVAQIIAVAFAAVRTLRT